MKALFKKTICILIIVSLALPLSGCYDAREVDNFAYVIAIGIDKGVDNLLNITFEIALTNALSEQSASGSSGGSENKKSTIIVTAQAPSIASAISMLQASVAREIILSHIKIFIISEEFAKEGVENIFNSIIRHKNFRPGMYIVVSLCPANEYISSVSYKLDTNPSKFYEFGLEIVNHIGFIPNSTETVFYNDLKSLDSTPLAILGSVDKASSEELNTSSGLGPGGHSAGNIPIKTLIKSELMGSAVFLSGKMIGTLNGEQTSIVQLVKKKKQRFPMTIKENPTDKVFSSIDVFSARPTKVNVKIVNGKPFIKLNFILEADIQSSQSSQNFEDPSYLASLEDKIEDTIKKQTIQTLYLARDKYKADFFGFGKKAKSLVYTWDNWEKLNWPSIFPYSTFSVDVDVKIRRTGMLIKSFPIPLNKKEQ